MIEEDISEIKRELSELRQEFRVVTMLLPDPIVSRLMSDWDDQRVASYLTLRTGVKLGVKAYSGIGQVVPGDPPRTWDTKVVPCADKTVLSLVDELRRHGAQISMWE